MLKKLSYLIFVVAAVLAPASRAGAATIIQDVFDPTTDQLFGKHSTALCVGDNTADTITGQDAAGCYSLSYAIQLPGYSNPPDTLTFAGLVLSFYDDTDPGNNKESVT